MSDAGNAARRRARHSTQVFSASQTGRQSELQLLQTVMRRGSTSATDGRIGVTKSEDLWEEGDEAVRRRQLHLSVEFEALSISVVDGSPKELLYVTLGGLSFAAAEGPNDEDRERGLSAPSGLGEVARAWGGNSAVGLETVPKRWEQRVRLRTPQPKRG